MPDDAPSKFAMPPLLKGALIFLGVLASGGMAYLKTPSGDLTLPASPTIPIVSAFGALLLVWIGLTYSLWRRDWKREVIKDAISKGRLTCDCTKEGEIMLSQHSTTNMELDVYTCHACGRLEVVSPAGAVLICEDTKFSPPLPATARKKWLQESNAKRRK